MVGVSAWRVSPQLMVHPRKRRRILLDDRWSLMAGARHKTWSDWTYPRVRGSVPLNSRVCLETGCGWQHRNCRRRRRWIGGRGDGGVQEIHETTRTHRKSRALSLHPFAPHTYTPHHMHTYMHTPSPHTYIHTYMHTQHKRHSHTAAMHMHSPPCGSRRISWDRRDASKHATHGAANHEVTWGDPAGARATNRVHWLPTLTTREGAQSVACVSGVKNLDAAVALPDVAKTNQNQPNQTKPNQTACAWSVGVSAGARRHVCKRGTLSLPT